MRNRDIKLRLYPVLVFKCEYYDKESEVPLMYIAMQTADSNGTLNTEICTLYGIRYDTRYRSAILSTEHMNHDYIIPMTPTDYEDAAKQIMAAMAAKVHMINLGSTIVSRGRKGEARQVQPQKIKISLK